MESNAESSASVSTIRGVHHLNTVHPDLALSFDFTQLPSSSGSTAGDASPAHSLSRPSSPHSALPSPSSPSGDSISSFPSVSSSFLFSSGPASPPQLHIPHSLRPESDAEGVGLVIPSLMLPSASRRPTPYGQTLGDVRLLVLAPRGGDTTTLVNELLDDNDDIVEVGTWEETECGAGASSRSAVLRASTCWIEHRDAHGLDRVEPARNIEIVELPGYDPLSDVETVLKDTLPAVHAPFSQIHEALNPDYAPNTVLANLLSSSSTPMYTALILLQTTLPTATEKALLGALSPHVPLIVLPPVSAYPHPYSHVYPSSSDIPSPFTKPPATLSAFRPSTVTALRTGLFRSPETLALLRSEAMARFLRWREVERAVARVDAHADSTAQRHSGAARACVPSSRGRARWDKAAWEAQWEGALSQDVAVQLGRRRAGTAVPPRRAHAQPEAATAAAAASTQRCTRAFDPLHVPSLVAFSFSLFGPLRARLLARLGLARAPMSEKRDAPARRMGYSVGLVGLALVGAFCAGIGLGWLVAQA